MKPLLLALALAALLTWGWREYAAAHRRPKGRIPTIEEFRRMGPERVTEWHRQSGIEARVMADPEWAEIDEALAR